MLKRPDLLEENETAEDCETSVERNRLSNGQSAHTERKSHRRKGAQSDNRNTCQKRAAHVEVRVVPSECMSSVFRVKQGRRWTYFAVAPMYESEPTTPQVYSAALDRIAGLRKNSGLRVAA